MTGADIAMLDQAATDVREWWAGLSVDEREEYARRMKVISETAAELFPGNLTVPLAVYGLNRLMQEGE